MQFTPLVAGGDAFAEQRKLEHLEDVRSLYMSSPMAFHNASADVYTAQTSASSNGKANKGVNKSSFSSIRPDGRVIWNTAPFFNKTNLTPRVNVFFG